MRFYVTADTDSPPLRVILEPYGMEYVLAPGDHFVFEWPEEPNSMAGSIEHEPGQITIGQSNSKARIWNSHGEELSMFGGKSPTS
jgi:hypothetical protein